MPELYYEARRQKQPQIGFKFNAGKGWDLSKLHGHLPWKYPKQWKRPKGWFEKSGRRVWRRNKQLQELSQFPIAFVPGMPVIWLFQSLLFYYSAYYLRILGSPQITFSTLSFMLDEFGFYQWKALEKKELERETPAFCFQGYLVSCYQQHVARDLSGLWSVCSVSGLQWQQWNPVTELLLDSGFSAPSFLIPTG